MIGNIDLSKLSPKDIEALNSILSDVVLFAESFLVNPKKGTPLELNYVQRKILSEQSQFTVIRVHRRAGKSWLFAIYAIWYAVTHDYGKVLIICPDQTKVNLIFEAVDGLIQASPGLSDCLVRSRDMPMNREFDNGSTIKGYTTGSRSRGEAENIRGEAADVLMVDEAAYLDARDWPAVEPIMYGDVERAGRVINFVSSTPSAERGMYWRMCTKMEHYRKIHIPITENPDWTEELIAPIRAGTTESTFKQEFLALFPDIGEGIYKRSYIDRAAQQELNYYNLSDPNLTIKPATRTMGVDWDKYQGTGPNIIVLELDKEAGVFRAVYHEEIPPSEYCLTLAVERIIWLNGRLNPQWIYVDRGYGEASVETLHKHGELHPETGLREKIKGISFSETVDVIDPVLGETVKKKIKPLMVNTTVKWFEDNRFVYPASHKLFTEQLQDFKVVGMTDQTIRYSSENEHIIDAFCLAAWAMYSNFDNPFIFEPARTSYLLPTPEAVPAKSIDPNTGKPWTAFGAVRDTYRVAGFGRRDIGTGWGRKTIDPDGELVGHRRSF